VLPFEILPLEPDPVAVEPTRLPVKQSYRPLPLYVTPLSEESLLSWLHRLATRLNVSFHTLASHSFGIDDRGGRSVWWHRPHPWALARISQRTGVSIPRLRRMTFEELQPDYREDEDPARFAGRRFDCRAPDRRSYRFAVCGPCLEGDAATHVRTLWQLGWLAVCPKHQTILLSRCELCHAGFRTAHFATAAPFAPSTCPRCKESLLCDVYAIGDPSVIRLQEALLKGKTEGVTELTGLGTFTWKEIVALADILLGMVWTDTTLDERNRIWGLYEYEDLDAPRAQMQIYSCRHDSLRFLAWLIEGWPDSLGASIGRDMLWRGLSRQRNRLSHHVLPRWPGHPWSPSPHDFSPDILARLRKLLEV
jgi:hypothetical protein